MDNIKPLRIEVRLRNNQMAARREALGFNQAQAAEASGVSGNAWCLLEGLKRKPVLKDGGWCLDALRISDFFEVAPGEIWPSELELLDGRRRSVEIDFIEAAGLLEAVETPYEIMEKRERDQELLGSMLTLDDRGRSIVLGRIVSEETLKEVGDRHGVSRERARQLEARALARVRGHFARSDLDEDWYRSSG